MSEGSDMRVEAGTGRILSKEDVDSMPEVEFLNLTKPLYRVEVEHVKEFCVFLRSCGGFKVF